MEDSRGNSENKIKDIIDRVNNLLAVQLDSPELNEELDGLRTSLEILTARVIPGEKQISESISKTPSEEKFLNDDHIRFRALVDCMGEGFMQICNKGIIRYVNRRFCEMTGYEESELIGKKSRNLLLTPEQSELARSKKRLRDIGVADSYEIEMRRKNGDRFWGKVSGTPLKDPGGNIIGSLGLISDVTDRRRAEEALRISEERSVLSARGGGDGLWDWDLINDEVYYSAGWKAILGCDPQEVGGTADEWFIRVHPEDMDRFREETRSWSTGQKDNFKIEHRMLHRDGTYRWVMVRGAAVRNQEDEVYRLVGSIMDITAQRFYDALTGLPNRELFYDRLQQAMQRSRRKKNYQYAVMLLNVDRYRIINETLGQSVGDQLIVMVARIIQKCLRDGDTVARHDGDQFAILMADIKDLSKPSRVAQRIHKGMEHPFTFSGLEVYVDTSIGIALSATGYESTHDPLKDAEAAMRRARGNRNGLELFDKSMHSRAMGMLEFENDLRRSVRREELELYYQPIVSIQSGSLVGFEALTRWNHEKRGFVSPAEFIPVAEETGLIVELGHWVLCTALAQSKVWRDEGFDFFVSVNFSARQFQQRELKNIISRALSETKVEPGCLKLELTESVFMGNEEAAIETLASLKSLGVQLSIDDFGTGYSSLSYLKRFPVDSLKIDKAFVQDLPNNPADAAIIYAIVNMAHSLKLKVIAEGVQNEEQLKFLRMSGCDHMQGFYYSRPLPVSEVLNLLKAKKPLFTPTDSIAHVDQ